MQPIEDHKAICRAPDLLEALKKIVFNAGDCPEYCVFQAIAEAAIAKAEGRK